MITITMFSVNNGCSDAFLIMGAWEETVHLIRGGGGEWAED